ncbi:MAG: hypothetical protein JWQ27_1823 [Ferruginibacter sp.]|nr:hypothetical protein [Ferruginibacter sp.]
MRKIISLLILTVASHFCYAQFSTVQFSPATFTGEDAVTFTIDLTGTSLAGETEVYIWAFANSGLNDPQYPSKDGYTNTDWGNSPATAKLTSLGGNKWSYTLTGTDLFNPLTLGQLKYFQFLIKTKTGSKQTSDSPKYPFAPVVYVPAVYRLFPSRMNQDDAITVYFYQNLSTDITESRMAPVSMTIKLYNASGVQFGSNITLPVRSLGNKLYSASFIPAVSVAIPAGTTLGSFTYAVNGSYFDVNGATINVTGPENTKTFDVLHF